MIAGTLFLLACGSSGSEFVGTWQNDREDTVSIKHNQGKQFFVTRVPKKCLTCLDPNERRADIENKPALLEDGVLKMDNGFTTLVIDKESGMLVFDEREYKRISEKP